MSTARNRKAPPVAAEQGLKVYAERLNYRTALLLVQIVSGWLHLLPGGVWIACALGG